MTYPRTRERLEHYDYTPSFSKYENGGRGTVITNIDYTEFHNNYPLLDEVTVDEVHSDYPYEGGPFDSVKVKTNLTPGMSKQGYAYTIPWNGIYVCQYWQGLHIPLVPRISTKPDSVLNLAASYGADAWEKFKPAKPDVSLSVFFAELRDIPGLVFKKLNSFRNLGSNYLAVQFGWKPFLSDLRDWYKSIISIDQRIAQLKKDNGQFIKRGGTLFENIEDPVIGISQSPYKVWGPPRKSVKTTTISELRTKCWFSARFRYYIPGLDSAIFGSARAIQQLWDLEITPEQVWQLLPFSWLVDWFANVGSIVSNLMSAVQDNLTAKYAYVMLERDHTYTTQSAVTSTFKTSIYGSLVPTVTTSTLVQTFSAKARAGANPFGFNVDFSSLSNYQTSILAALGLSRLRF